MLFHWRREKIAAAVTASTLYPFVLGDICKKNLHKEERVSERLFLVNCITNCEMKRRAK